jgi:hypothetical protein
VLVTIDCSVPFSRLRTEVFVILVLFVAVVFCVTRRGLLGGNVRPLVSILAVQLLPAFLTGFSFGLDGFVRALGLTHTAVDALVGMDDEHVLALVKAVDGADLDAVGELALDAILVDDVRHAGFLAPAGSRAHAGTTLTRLRPIGLPGAM